MIERIYISIKKNYGDDLPKLPSAKKDSDKKKLSKIEAILEKTENLLVDKTDGESEPKDGEDLKILKPLIYAI